MCRRPLQLSLYLTLFAPFALHAQVPAATTAQDLKRLSIEELAEIDVTSVSRRPERLAQTAAAVSIVRQEDIRRSGAMTLGETMRLADGLDVARADGRTWAVSARGFTISTANKMLVLMDGRTLYSPLFGGTLWDVQDTLVADIDRIEVVRGPGGTVWGANAVNGVVNILTKDASTTHGNAAGLTFGTEERLVAAARHGGRLGTSAHYRVFGKYRRRDANVFSTGEPAADELQFGQGGFRLDSGDTAATRWTLQGDAYRGSEGLFDRADTDVAGGNLLARWVRRYSADSDLRIEAFYDRTTRNVPLQYEATQDTFDVDAQRRLQLGGRHDLVVGGDFRVTSARDIGKAGFVFDPEHDTDTLFSVFAQDEIALRPQIFLTLGSKFERNDFTGFEVQPTARGRWSPSDRQTLWGAVSRAVRLPTRFDTDLRIVNPLTGATVLSGSPDFDAESVVAYEAGYRVRPHTRMSVDVAAYANRYDRLRSQELPEPGRPFTVLGNMLNAVTSGFEAATTIQVLDAWRVHAWGAYLHKDLSLDAGSRDVTSGRDEGNDPSFHMAVRSQLDLPGGFALDGVFRHVSKRPFPSVPAYAELDLRFGWAVRTGWDLSLVGHNLLHDQHPELGSNAPRRYEFERGVFLRSAWRF